MLPVRMPHRSPSAVREGLSITWMTEPSAQARMKKLIIAIPKL